MRELIRGDHLLLFEIVQYHPRAAQQPSIGGLVVVEESLICVILPSHITDKFARSQFLRVTSSDNLISISQAKHNQKSARRHFICVKSSVMNSY